VKSGRQTSIVFTA